MDNKPLSIEKLLSLEACCGNKCTNCPYEPMHTKGSTELYRDSPKQYYGLEGVSWQQ